MTSKGIRALKMLDATLPKKAKHIPTIVPLETFSTDEYNKKKAAEREEINKRINSNKRLIGKKRKRADLSNLASYSSPKKRKKSKTEIKNKEKIKQESVKLNECPSPFTPPSISPDADKNESVESTPEWGCPHCTFMNTTEGYICSMCNKSDIQRKKSLQSVEMSAFTGSNDKLLCTLRQRFAFKSFRLSQRNSINAVLNGKDVVLVMPAGSSKSLCYQLPGLISHKLTIVISPLRGRVKSYCDDLQRIGINAKMVVATTSDAERNQIFGDLEYGLTNIEIVYTTEDAINSKEFENILKVLYAQDKIGLFAINMCSTGHNFQSTYIKLDGLRDKYPNVPIMAVSTRADEKARIIKSFHLRMDVVVIDKMDFYELSVDDLFTLFDEWFAADNRLSKNGLRDKLVAKYFIEKKGIKKDRRFLEAINLLKNKYAP